MTTSANAMNENNEKLETTQEQASTSEAPSRQSQKPQPSPNQPLDNPNSLRVDFSVKVRGADQVLAQFASGFEFAFGLEPDFLASTDASFSEVFNRLVTQPVEIAVRRSLQRRFEAMSGTAAQGSPVAAPAQARHRSVDVPPASESLADIVAKNEQAAHK